MRRQSHCRPASRRYRDWDQDFEIVPEGKIVVAGTGYLAGSWAFTDHCVATVLALNEVTLADAIDMATTRPRALLGLPPRALAPGQPAELVLFDWQPGEPLQWHAPVIGPA